jgi:hypothetical protein
MSKAVFGRMFVNRKLYKNKPKILIGCSVVFVCILTLIALSWIVHVREGVNLVNATKVDREFIENIHDLEIDRAYLMLSEKIYPFITKEQFSALIYQDEHIFKEYDNLEICDWGVYIDNGLVIDTTGLLYYNSKAIVVQISLHKDSDSVWRVQGFRFSSDISAEPFGLCK